MVSAMKGRNSRQGGGFLVPLRQPIGEVVDEKEKRFVLGGLVCTLKEQIC